MTIIPIGAAHAEAPYVVRGFGLKGATMSVAGHFFGDFGMRKAHEIFGPRTSRKGINGRLMLLAFLATIDEEDLQ